MDLLEHTPVLKKRVTRDGKPHVGRKTITVVLDNCVPLCPSVYPLEQSGRLRPAETGSQASVSCACPHLMLG